MGLLLQLLIDGIARGAAYALLALGLALIWSVTGVFHLAHGAVYVLGGYFIYAFSEQLGLPVWLAVPLAAATAALLGVAIDRVVYRPLAERGARSLTFTIASLATLIFLMNLAAAVWGTETRQFGDFDVVEGYALGPAYVSGVEIATVIVSAVLFAACLAILHFTRTGRALRAMADNETMARIVGMDLGRVRSAAYAIGSALAVPAAYLAGLQTGINPYSGTLAILIASAAVIVGGIGSLAGAGLGAVVLALAQTLGIWKIPSEWQDSIAFGVLMLVVLLRPTGLFGKRLAGKGV
jgi:branched-chain amino acid transport system permease protein